MMLPTSLMMSLSNLMKLSAPTCGDDDDDDDDNDDDDDDNGDD